MLETLSKCEDVEDPVEHVEMLRQLRQEVQESEEKVKLRRVFEAVGNPDRFAIVDLLRGHSLCVCELEAALGKSQSTVSHHLRFLERAGLVRGWKKGKFTHYSLVEGAFKEFLRAVESWGSGVANWFSDAGEARG
ncbi:MAG: metalloregulator ArsR/SmtB family transcription factor [Promethearchaeota archaeon]